MKIPTVEEAELLLRKGYQLNPGPWFGHSQYTGKAAYLIIEYFPHLDPEVGYILGLLHDIGRRAGNYNMRHTIDGYNYLMELGYEDAARICITHLFPYKKVNASIGIWDCTPEQFRFIDNYLNDIEFTTYEKIVQLSDYLALENGFSMLEKRLVDVAIRYGTDEYTVPRWQALFNIKDEMEKIIGKSVYAILPGVIENTFDINV